MDLRGHVQLFCGVCKGCDWIVNREIRSTDKLGWSPRFPYNALNDYKIKGLHVLLNTLFTKIEKLFMRYHSNILRSYFLVMLFGTAVIGVSPSILFVLVSS